jgi:hypothetical protein
MQVHFIGLGRYALAWVTALTLVGCGAGRAEDIPAETPASAANAAQSSPQGSGPSSAITELKLYVASPMRTHLAAAVAARLQAALAAAGYNLVTSEAAPHDLTARLAVSATQEPSLFQVTVNGRRQVKLKVHVALAVAGDAGILDEVTHDFDSSNGEVNDEDLSPVVTRLSRSSRLSRYASDRTQALKAKAQADQAAAAQAQAQANQAAQDQAREEEESVWIGARPLGCRMPATLGACDAVRLYVARYPAGIHADEAKRTLDEAAPRLESLQKDENSWLGAGAATCRLHADPHACDGVDLYLVKYPAGLHADEARSLTAKPASQP